MARTKFLLDNCAIGRVFSWGTTSAGGEATVTFNKGTQATSFTVADFKGSVNIDGNIVIGGNLTLTGTIDTQTVTNTNVTDKTITVNDGGTTVGATGAGLIVEGDSGAVIAQISYATASATKFQIGDGTTQIDIVGISNTQTLTNKTVNATNNTITDTSTALGDLFKSNGTKFVRFARGTANQQLRTNAGGTDLEWFTPTAQKEFQEVGLVSPTYDGVNKVYTLANAVTANSIQVFLDGQLLRRGASNDYVYDGTTTVTLQTAMEAPNTATNPSVVLTVFGSY